MSAFLTPVLALILWTLLIWVLLFARRVPAMRKLSKDPQQFIRDPALIDQLPLSARWTADNYNHLHEQPVIFYALMSYLFLTEQTGSLNAYLAWAYVAFRVAHSLVQVSVNYVVARFGLFVGASLCLFALALRALLALW